MKRKRIMAAGDPPLEVMQKVLDHRTVEVNGKTEQQVQVLFLGNPTWINTDPRDIVWDPHDCM